MHVRQTSRLKKDKDKWHEQTPNETLQRKIERALHLNFRCEDGSTTLSKEASDGICRTDITRERRLAGFLEQRKRKSKKELLGIPLFQR